MSKYLEEAKRLRSAADVHYNCSQAVILPFAEDFGMTQEQAFRVSANFGGGMKMGSVCGAVTGALMALGLMGIDDPADANAFCREIRSRHEGCLECRDLLRINHEKGGQKKPHCDAMVFECVLLAEQMMKERGISSDHN